MRRAGALVRGTRAVQQCPPPLEDSRRPAIPAGALASLPGRRGYGERRVHTRAHTPREHAQCGPGNFLPSRERPWPLPGPLLAKLGAAGSRVWVAPRPAVALWRSGSLHSLSSAPARLSSTALAAGNRGVDVIPAPRGQVEGWVARGLAVRLPARWTRSVRSPRARTPCSEQPGWKGVCEHPALGAHTRCHTQSLGFIATAP